MFRNLCTVYTRNIRWSVFVGVIYSSRGFFKKKSLESYKSLKVENTSIYTKCPKSRQEQYSLCITRMIKVKTNYKNMHSNTLCWGCGQTDETQHVLERCFSTSGSRPHLGSPSDFRGIARLSTNFLKNDIRSEKCWPNSPTYSTDVDVLRGWGRAQITVRHFGSQGEKG